MLINKKRNGKKFKPFVDNFLLRCHDKGLNPAESTGLVDYALDDINIKRPQVHNAFPPVKISDQCVMFE